MSDINLIDFISSLFRLQLTIKMNHWSTKYYHRHKITDKLHTNILSLIDRLVETFQGRYGKLSVNNDTSSLMINVPLTTDDNFPKVLRDIKDSMIQSVYYKMDKDLTAIMDELLELIDTNQYLLMLK